MYGYYQPNMWSALGQVLGSYWANNNKSNPSTQQTLNNNVILPQQKSVQQNVGQSLIPNTFTANNVTPPVSASNLGNNIFNSSGILDIMQKNNGTQTPFFY